MKMPWSKAKLASITSLFNRHFLAANEDRLCVADYIYTSKKEGYWTCWFCITKNGCIKDLNNDNIYWLMIKMPGEDFF